jgi:hypothetical protein
MRLSVPHRTRRAEREARSSRRRALSNGQSRHARTQPERGTRRREGADALAGGDPGAAGPVCDPELARAREAGGPIDRASYGCTCGYQFSAAVSTTVNCPHCGSDQAW